MECSSQVFSTIFSFLFLAASLSIACFLLTSCAYIDRCTKGINYSFPFVTSLCKAPRRTTNLGKLEQLESRKSTDVTPIKNRQLSAKKHADKIERIQKKMSKPNEKMMELEREKNKEVESYPRVLSATGNSPKERK